MKQINPDLTDEQKAVLFEKATEAPFSGNFINLHNDGVYTCANCGAELFRSDTKFDSGSGWPSFDDALPGSVTTTQDVSHGMVRSQITCANCGGHLGHVFPDGPTDTTGLRYCVNSLSLGFNEHKTSQL